MSAYDDNLKAAHEAAVAAKTYLNAAAQQAPADERERAEAAFQEAESLVYNVFDLREDHRINTKIRAEFEALRNAQMAQEEA